MSTKFTPDNYKISYLLTEIKKTFRKYELHTTEKPHLLPEIVRLEKNNGYNQIKNADNLLRVRDATNWNKCTLTGLRPTGTPNFYYSDLPVNGVKSLIVVFIPSDAESIVLRVCKQFYPPKENPTYRSWLINQIISNW
jgi:hypothetical protein